MSLVIFAVGAFIFLITVYGTVVSGGLVLTHRQLDDQPLLSPGYTEAEAAGIDGDVDAGRVRRLVETQY